MADIPKKESSPQSSSDSDTNDDDMNQADAEDGADEKLSYLKVYPSNNPTESQTFVPSIIDSKSGKYKCELCRPNKEYATRTAFKLHYEGAHLKVRYKCVACDKVLASYHTFMAHRRSSHLKQKFKCEAENCNKEFKHRPSLRLHQQNEHIELLIRFQCDGCERRFKTGPLLRSHQRDGCGGRKKKGASVAKKS